MKHCHQTLITAGNQTMNCTDFPCVGCCSLDWRSAGLFPFPTQGLDQADYGNAVLALELDNGALQGQDLGDVGAGGPWRKG